MTSKHLATLSDPRLTEHWQNVFIKNLPAKAEKNAVCIVSYADDEGVRLNNGRLGASEGPARILYYLGRMVQRNETPSIVVLQDRLLQPSLEKRHAAAETAMLDLFSRGFRVISLGGGHDYGLPDTAAYFQSFKGKIVNVDAHLDTRPVIDLKLNSGTAFFRFMERFSGKHLIHWGLQDHCNAASHWKHAKTNGCKLLRAKDPMPKIKSKVGMSICLDAFSGIRGVSAPTFTGIPTEEGMKFVDFHSPRSKWLGLYECAPRYDPLNEDSARLGAVLAYRFIHGVR